MQGCKDDAELIRIPERPVFLASGPHDSTPQEHQPGTEHQLNLQAGPHGGIGAGEGMEYLPRVSCIVCLEISLEVKALRDQEAGPQPGCNGKRSPGRFPSATLSRRCLLLFRYRYIATATWDICPSFH